MKLSSGDLNCLSQCAMTAAEKAGQLITSYAGGDVEVRDKPAGGSLASQVLTEVDLLSQDIILDILTPTCKRFDLALLSEERVDDQNRLEMDYFWSIDPLDGTLPFVEGTNGFAVSIALVSQDGTPVVGAVYDPTESCLYHAVKGQGAFRNGAPLVVEQANPSITPTLTFITDRSFVQHSRFNDCLAGLNRFAATMGWAGVSVIHHGGAVMNACWVLEAQPACYFKFPKKLAGGGSLWDYAATACIAAESGATAADIHGQPLDLNRSNSTFMNHNGILYASDPSITTCIVELYKMFG